MACRTSKTAKLNRAKYLKAPTPQEVYDFIDELGVTDLQFERFYNIPSTTISQIRAGNRNLPAAFWGIVYEKKVPAYSVEFIGNSDYLSNKVNSTKTTTSNMQESSDLDHGRLTTVKDK